MSVLSYISNKTAGGRNWCTDHLCMPSAAQPSAAYAATSLLLSTLAKPSSNVSCRKPLSASANSAAKCSRDVCGFFYPSQAVTTCHGVGILFPLTVFVSKLLRHGLTKGSGISNFTLL